MRRTGLIARRVSLRRKPQRDPVTPAVREFVLARDRQCLAYKVEYEHVCRDAFGNVHRPDDLERLTLDHVKSAAMMGRRAPSDPGHLVALCAWANTEGWASAHRTEERAYLRSVAEYDPHAWHVDPCGPDCTPFVR